MTTFVIVVNIHYLFFYFKINLRSINLISHFYFNWNGPRDGVTEYGKKLEAACKRAGTKFIGVYAPHQDNWNYVSIIQGKTIADVYKDMG